MSGLTSDPSDLFADRIRDLGERTPGGEASPKGALGVMQVMPQTATNPGFGLRPAEPGNAADLTRLGREYAKTLLQKYQGNEVLASAAYNAGPGKVDQWIKEFGDPRNGEISSADWANRVPYGETRGYAQRVGLPAAGPIPVQTGEQTNALASSTAAPPSSAPAAPVAAPAPIQALPLSLPSPAKALALLQLLTPPTHMLHPVDYDPWRIQRMGVGMSG